MNTQTRPRPAPRPTPTTQPFWDAAAKNKLMLQYDPVSQRYQFWPRACSVRTGKRNLRWQESEGRGTLYSFTETHVPTAGFEGKEPYLIGLVELDEGVRMIANLVNVKPDGVEIGMKLKIAWERISDDMNYFAFEPAG